MEKKLIALILVLWLTISMASFTLAEDYDEPIGSPIKVPMSNII